MATVALSGNDTLIIQGRVLRDLADGNVGELEFPNEIMTVKTGKNGNSIYGLNESGKQANLKLRIIRGSADDKFLNALLASQQSLGASFPLLGGEFIKQVGDGQGNVTSDQYICGGGVFTKQVPGKSNVEGDSEQSVAMYELKFANAPRVLT